MTQMHEYDGCKLSDEHIDLLENAICERESAKITLNHARRIYSGKNAAQNALTSLENKGEGILERKGNGVWRIRWMPESLMEEFQA